MADSGGGVNWPTIPSFGQTIANLPTDYYKALENNYTQRNRDLFVNGLPTNANGQTDYGEVFKRVLQSGGVPGINSAASALQLGIAAQAPQANADAVRFLATGDNPQSQPQPEAPRGMPSIQTPRITPGGNLSSGDGQLTAGRTSQPQPTQRPAGSPAGDNGRDTMMTYITSKVGPENAGYVAALIKGTDPNAPMPPGYEAAADRAIAAWQAKNGGGAQPQPQQQPQTAQLQQPMQAPQAQPLPPAGDASRPDPTLGGLVPNGWEPTQYLAALQLRAANPSLSAPVLKTYQTKIEAIQKVLAQRGELTPEQKNAAAAGLPLLNYTAEHAQTEARGKSSGEAFAKRYEAIQETGAKAAQEIPQLEYAEGLMKDPNFYSGVGDNYNLIMKRISVALGGDPNSAAPQEAFRKVVSNSILQSLGQLKGLGQIRVAEINLAKEAAASTTNTPAANQILLTVAKRLNQRAADIAEIAQNYNGGNLDSGFDRLVAIYDKKNPVFSLDEISDWRRVIGQTTPGSKGSATGGIPRIASPAEAARLPSRSKFYDPDGVLRQVP